MRKIPRDVEITKLITYPKLLILRALADSEPIGGIEYSDLLGFVRFHISGFNDGKLMHHLRMLESVGMVEMKKEKFANDIRTVVSLTDRGKVEFEEILTLLKKNIIGGNDE